MRTYGHNDMEHIHRAVQQVPEPEATESVLRDGVLETESSPEEKTEPSPLQKLIEGFKTNE